ncbi:MAG TPA: EVE domain-containing protein [Nitrospira sp.]|nr:EVE domain-containing protein [Nitrospira sp.]
MTRSPRYWLVKSEPTSFSIDDLARAPRQTTAWDGVRNYQERNFIREMAVGDRVLFYHSNAEPPAVVGSAEVVKAAYPDDTQFDRHNHHFDPASTRQQPRWDMVDLKFREKFHSAVPLDQLRQESQLKEMVLLRKGSRLSVQPVAEREWSIIVKLGRSKKGSR